MPEEYDQRRLPQVARMSEMIGPMTAAIDWPPEQLAAHRLEGFRSMLRFVREKSPFHARRVSGLDPDRVTLANLADIPPMTKSDLMENWDEIVTDSRLTLERCERHLDALSAGPAYFENDFHVLASGGSSGRRGVFVFGWDDWAMFFAANSRWALRGIARSAAVPREGTAATASVAAETLGHATVALARCFVGPGISARSFPVSLPLGEIVSGLNAVMPEVLFAYSSALNLLAGEALAGRLEIRPSWISASSEPLLPEIAERVEQAFSVRPVNVYGTSDVGLLGSGCGEASGIHLSDDMVLVEPVDASGLAVEAETQSAKIFVTEITPQALPLLRYELTDEVTVLDAACECGSSFTRIADIQGRLDDVFEYAGGVKVHPHVFRSLFTREPNIVEYQVRQTPVGAEVLAVGRGPVAGSELENALVSRLKELGIVNPAVTLRLVDEIPRVGIGKLKRFVSL